MAEKNIEIKMAVTGAEQSAAAIRQVAAAATPQTAKDLLGPELSARMDALREGAEALDGAMNDASESSVKLDENVGNIARAQKAQAIASLAGQVGMMGAKFENAAKSVEKFDPALAATLQNTGETMQKVSSGVSAIATGFAVGGPIGAGVAGLTVLAGELANSWINAGQAATAMDQQTGAALASVVGPMEKVATEKAKLETKAWITTLTEEESAIKAQNEALDRNAKLLEAAVIAKAKISQAKANKETAEIDADTTLSDSEKIKRKAAVKERVEKEKVEAEVNKEGRGVKAAEDDAAAKQAEAQRLQADAEAVAQRQQEVDAELKTAERREKKRKNALEQLPKAQRDLELADKKEAIWGSNPLRSKEDQQDATKEAEAARRNVENLQNDAFADPKNAVNAEALRAKKAATDAAAEKTREAARKAADDAAKQKLDAEAKREQFDINKGAAVETYAIERDTRKIQTDDKVRTAEKQAKDKKDREQKQADAKRDREQMEANALAERKADAGRDLETDIVGLGKDAADATRGLGAPGSEGFNTLARKIAKKGDSAGDQESLKTMLTQLGRLVDAIPDSKSGSADAQTLRAVERKLEQKLAVLQSQIKNSRPPSR